MSLGFNLKNVLNSFIFQLCSRVLLILMRSRSTNSSIVIDAKNEVYQARITNLNNLLNLDYESLIASSTREVECGLNSDGSTFSSPRTDNVKMNWRETHRLKGEVMLRILFRVASQCVQCLTAETWKSLTHLLVCTFNLLVHDMSFNHSHFGEWSMKIELTNIFKLKIQKFVYNDFNQFLLSFHGISCIFFFFF